MVREHVGHALTALRRLLASKPPSTVGLAARPAGARSGVNLL